MAHPVPTKAVLQPNPDITMLFVTLQMHPPHLFSSRRAYFPRTLPVVTSQDKSSHCLHMALTIKLRKELCLA